jgi:sugar lactone lactonase YvrE
VKSVSLFTFFRAIFSVPRREGVGLDVKGIMCLNRHIKSQAIFAIALLGCRVLPGQTIFLAVRTPEIQEFNASGASSTFATADLSEPSGLVFDSSGNLFVSNFGSSTIVELNSAGSPTVFATSSLNEPEGMGFWNGFLYVANYGGNDIVKFNAAGQATYIGSVQHPTGLAFDSSGNLYVASQTADSIYKFTLGGSESEFAGPSSGLNSPAQITFNGGNLFVANYYSSDILEFNPGGAATVFASTGGGYSNPLGLAFDGSNNLYVSCAGNFIEQFSTNGNSSGFASTENGPWMLAVENVPEPSCWAFVALAAGAMLYHRRTGSAAPPAT